MYDFNYGLSRIERKDKVEVAHYLGWYVYISLKAENRDFNYVFRTPDEVLDFLLCGEDKYERERALSVN